MSAGVSKKHPFLDDLTDETELRSTIMRHPVTGRQMIRRLVDAVGTQYVSQHSTFFGMVGDRHVLQYEATLRNGRKIEAIGVIERDGTDAVRRVTIAFSPLDAALSLSAALGNALNEPGDARLFL